ncbi:unnamed protein product [Angiostrongylus costaricensis]|uniref:PIH1 domain-containing protein n=1 Tax=Angiostrongylus costaricensis TaxID=334426 RepID=A0A0R3PER9_ANGCS|nr:unnamed protein product [Angiostrongylus costaricensis]
MALNALAPERIIARSFPTANTCDPEFCKYLSIIKNIVIYVQVNMKEIFGETKEHKCFLNICHCEELPPPVDDIDEDELAARIDKGDIGFRIPVSIGELDSVVDNKNANQPKIDVLVNSTFYERRLAPPNANFFRHFFCMVVCEAIEDKHHLKLDPNKCVKLKNRTLMGYIEPMKIMKRPVAPVIQEITSTFLVNVLLDVLKYFGIQQPAGVHICLFRGTKLMIELFLKDKEISVIHRAATACGDDELRRALARLTLGHQGITMARSAKLRYNGNYAEVRTTSGDGSSKYPST